MNVLIPPLADWSPRNFPPPPRHRGEGVGLSALRRPVTAVFVGQPLRVPSVGLDVAWIYLPTPVPALIRNGEYSVHGVSRPQQEQLWTRENCVCVCRRCEGQSSGRGQVGEQRGQQQQRQR